ncbi:MAG: Na/Pi cotransporter family protein [Clostridiales bacterium]|nr:Na/Pi cotransporter family protein [Clostridiales bacterium]
MDIFGVLSLIGGLALFLYGMNVMGDGLTKLSGGKLEQILERLTSKRIMAVLLGLVVTAVIQSSSATTVMVVGFVNSGIMQLSQAVGVIMGANVGTTVTSWLLSLSGINGSNVFIKLLKPSSFSPILAIIGLIMTMSAKSGSKKKDVGNILVGFAVLMFGMETMSSSVSPLADDPNFTGILTMFSNPLLGLVAGLVLTAIIQSSSASVGILQALSLTGAVSFGTAIPIIMGQNIGTCVTALISSVGASKNARRASMIHLYFNIIGTAIFMIVFYSINAAIGGFAFLNNSASVTGIAVIHSVFNIGAVIIMYPFANGLVKLATITIPDKKGENPEDQPKPVLLDERFLARPAFAMELCRKAAIEMSQDAAKAFYLSLDNLKDYDEEIDGKIRRLEENADKDEDILSAYLVKLSNRHLAPKDSRMLSILLHCIGNFEQIADYAMRISILGCDKKEKNLEFSKKAIDEMDIYSQAVHDIVESTMEAFAEQDLEGARYIEPFEQVIGGLSLEVKQRHIHRLRKGKCDSELGLVVEDTITNFEQVSDCCSNIALSMLRVNEDGFDTHNYYEVLREEQADWFEDKFRSLAVKYKLPEKKNKLGEYDV